MKSAKSTANTMNAEGNQVNTEYANAVREHFQRFSEGFRVFPLRLPRRVNEKHPRVSERFHQTTQGYQSVCLGAPPRCATSVRHLDVQDVCAWVPHPGRRHRGAHGSRSGEEVGGRGGMGVTGWFFRKTPGEKLFLGKRKTPENPGKLRKTPVFFGKPRFSHFFGQRTFFQKKFRGVFTPQGKLRKTPLPLLRTFQAGTYQEARICVASVLWYVCAGGRQGLARHQQTTESGLHPQVDGTPLLLNTCMQRRVYDKSRRKRQIVFRGFPE